MITVYSGVSRTDACHEDWAAELTMAAYLVALRHCAAAKWLDLQLELWRALSAAVAASGRAHRRDRCTEDILAEFALVAYRITLPYGRRLSFLDLELELYHSLRRTILKS